MSRRSRVLVAIINALNRIRWFRSSCCQSECVAKGNEEANTPPASPDIFPRPGDHKIV